MHIHHIYKSAVVGYLCGWLEFESDSWHSLIPAHLLLSFPVTTTVILTGWSPKTEKLGISWKPHLMNSWVLVHLVLLLWPFDQNSSNMLVIQWSFLFRHSVPLSISPSVSHKSSNYYLPSSRSPFTLSLTDKHVMIWLPTRPFSFIHT